MWAALLQRKQDCSWTVSSPLQRSSLKVCYSSCRQYVIHLQNITLHMAKVFGCFEQYECGRKRQGILCCT